MSGSRRGDILRAIDRLEIADDDHLLRDDVARLLGMEWGPARHLASAPSAPRPPQQPPSQPASTRRVETHLDDGGTMPPSIEPPIDPVPEPFNLRRVKAPERRLPSWVNDAAPLKPVRTSAPHTPPVPVPLLNPLQARAVLSSALARRLPDGPIDLVRILERIGHGEAITELPRAELPSIARGVQLLIDRGDGMLPFAGDVIWIREALLRVVGSHALEVLQFAHAPLRGAGPKSRRTWKRYAELTPPRSGATIVAVTDLGVRDLEPPAQPAAVDEWIAFADHLDRLGCPLVALVPYARSRCPTALRRRFAIVEWDRRTTAGRVRALITRGLP